jgi:hypothetical protein
MSLNELGISVTIDAELARFEQTMQRAGRVVETSTSDMDKATRRAQRSFAQLEGRLDPAARALQRLDSGTQRVQRALQSGAVSADRAAQVQRRLNDQYEQTVLRVNGMSNALDRAEREFAAIRAQVDPTTVALERLEEQQQQVRLAMAAGVTTQTEGTRVLGLLDKQYKKVSSGAGNFGFAAQNAAFQVGDFATQVAGGTDATRALGQQLPQLLGGFGIWGAVIGAAVAVGGALAPMLLEIGDAAEESADDVEDFAEQMDGLAESIEDTRLRIFALQRGVDDLELARAIRDMETLERQRQRLLDEPTRPTAGRPLGAAELLQGGAAAQRAVTEQREDEVAALDEQIQTAQERISTLRDEQARLKELEEAGKRQTQAREDATRAIERAQEKIRDLTRETAVHRGELTEAEVEVMAYREALFDANVPLAQADALTRAFSAALNENADASAAAKAAEERRKDALRALEQAQKDAQRELERWAEETARIGQQVGETFTDNILDGFEGGFADIDALLKRWLKALAATALNNAIVVPISTQIVRSAPEIFGASARPAGSPADPGHPAAAGGPGGGIPGLDLLGGDLLGGGGLGGILNEPIFSTLPSNFVGPPMASQVFTVGNALTGAGLGFGLGSFIGPLVGGNSMVSGATGAAGGLAGAAIGSVVPGVGTVLGGLLGGGLGGLAGGFLPFGNRRPSVGPNSAARGTIGPGGLSVLTANADNGGDAARSIGILRGVAEGIGQVTAASGALAGEMGILATVNEKTGEITVEAAGRVGTFSDAAEATLFGVQALAGDLRGLGPAMEAAAESASSLEEASALMARLRGFQEVGVTVNETGRAVGEVLETFEQVTAAAEELGYSQARLADIERDRARALGLLRQEVESELAQALAELENAAAAEVAALRSAQAEQLRAAAAVGLDLVEVERLYGKRRLHVLQDFSDQQLRALLEGGALDQALGAFERTRRGLLEQVEALAGGFEAATGAFADFRASLQPFLDELALDDRLSVLSPAEQYQEAQAIFARTLAQAQAGDAAAIGRLQEAGRGLLDQSLAFNATSRQYGSDYDRVTAALQAFGTSDAFAEELTVAERQLDVLTEIRDRLGAADPEIARLSALFQQAGLDPALLEPLRRAREQVGGAQETENLEALREAYSRALIAGRAGERGAANEWRGIASELHGRGALPAGYRQDFADLRERFPGLDDLGFQSGGLITRLPGAFAGADSDFVQARVMPGESLAITRPGQSIVDVMPMVSALDAVGGALVGEVRALRAETVQLRGEVAELGAELAAERRARDVMGAGSGALRRAG